MPLPLTIHDAAQALRSGELTAAALTAEVLARADRLDASLGTYLARFDEAAMAAAERADELLADGVDLGPLHGIPVGIKDIISTLDGPTTGQSLVLDPAWGEAEGDAPVSARLRAAGAVITGKVTTMEFATGLPDPEKPFPIPRNAWDLGRFPGGSSSGTGNGVAAGLFLGGLGTDTGGSIRCPATYSGISGLKPTFGRVPKSGCTPVGYSLDTIGPMARSARDCAYLMAAIAGYDATDPCADDRPVEDYVGALTGELAGLRIGVFRPGGDDVDPAVTACFDEALAALDRAGASTTEVVVPYYDELTHATNVTSRCEAYAYHRPDLRTRWTDYGRPLRVGIAPGVLFSGADYVQAQRVRAVGVQAIGELFASVDVVATPTARGGAPVLDGLDRKRLLHGLFTPIWNAVGLPALSVPMGFDGDGMPLGLQLVGRPFEDATVLRAGDAYQQLTDWHLRVPSIVGDLAEAVDA